MNDVRSVAAVALTVALLTALAGCHASSPRSTSADRPPPPAPPAPGDASYDWHGMLIAPFGSMLKDVPLTLHEVLLFRDEAHGANAADELECYAPSTPPPRFVGRIPDEYLLCFKQDRLSRVQASVHLKVADAPAVFASACARWSKQTMAATAGAAVQGADASGAGTGGAGTGGAGPTGGAAQVPDRCEGHDGAIRFNGRLEEQPAQAENPAEDQVLSITLDSPPAP